MEQKLTHVRWSFAGTDAPDLPGLQDAEGRIWIRPSWTDLIVAALAGEEETIAELHEARQDSARRGRFPLPADWDAITVNGPAPAHLREFPDYDNGPAFEAIERALAPYGFAGSSWHNDANPSLMIEIGEERRIRVFVEYADPELREFSPVGIYLEDDSGETVISREIQSFEPDAVIAALHELLTEKGVTLPEISEELGTAELSDRIAAFSQENAIAWRSADEMLFEIPEGHPHRAEIRDWLVRFVEIWETVQAAEDEAADEARYRAWESRSVFRDPTDEDREIYPQADEILEHPDGGRIGVRYIATSGSGAAYDVVANRFDGTFETMTEARRALWNHHSRAETRAK